MPRYDYRCKGCGFEGEYIHSFKDNPEVGCPECGEVMSKFFTNVNFSIKNTALARRMREDFVREGEMRQELREDHLVEGVSPVAAQSLSQVYDEVKANGSAVKDQMQKTIEENKKKARVKQKAWQIGANRRVEKRTIETRERKAAEEQAKRKITVSNKKP